jgi:hypothetical protein
MAINFPTSPSDGDTHVVGSKSLWRWRFFWPNRTAIMDG